MFEEKPQAIRDRINSLAEESLQRSDPSWWFDILYQQANQDPNQVPWAKMQPHPYFQDWLDNIKQIEENDSVLVIGCGLGDDAQALANLGLKNITAFDISPHAINWCHQRFPNSTVNYVVADLFNLDPSWQKRFDLVYECRNIQALPLNVRTEVITNIANLVTLNGTLLVINRLHRDNDQPPSGPPWALSQQEFDLFQQFGFTENQVDTFVEGEEQQVTTLRIEYQKRS